MFERTEMLIGEENLNKLINASVTIIGIGGVGGSALECLVRSGVGNITIIDSDNFTLSNLNRQVISDVNNMGKSKVESALNRYKNINVDVNIVSKNIFLSNENIDEIGFPDYIIDACDTVDTKLEIIKYALKHNIKIISSMGMGNRVNPSMVYLTKLSKTEYDPLAKKIRTILRKDNISLNIPVVASKEIPIKSSVISSMMMVPSTAGIYMSYYIIDDITSKKE